MSKKCKDFGGIKENGEPCTRNSCWGVDGKETGVDDGKCKSHNNSKNKKIEKLKKQYLDIVQSEVMSYKKAAREIGRSHKTIWRWRNNDKEFDEKVEKAKSEQDKLRVEKVEDALFKRIFKGEAGQSLTIFWLKNKAEWSDKKSLEHTGKDGDPIKFEEISEKEIEEATKKHEQAFRGIFDGDGVRN